MKKIISFVSAFAMIASFAASMSVSAETYTEPTIYLEVECSSEDLKAGDTVTVTCKYAGFDVTPYDDANTGSGQKLNAYDAYIEIPGGFGPATQNKQFLRPGMTYKLLTESGASSNNFVMAESLIIDSVQSIQDPMQTSGDLFSVTMTLNKDVTEDLEFKLVTDYGDNGMMLTYQNWNEWTFVNTTTIDYNNAYGNGKLNFVNATLEAPKADPVLTGVTFDTADAMKNATTATVAGEAAYTLPAVYAVFDNETVDSTAVDAEWSVTGGGSIADGIYTAPAAPAYGEEPLRITLTATYEGQTATVTVTVPAESAPAEFCTVANDGAPTVTYYTEDDKKVEVFDCQTNKEAAGNTWYFTFVKNGVEREFQGDMTTIAGGANVIFKAWMISADGGVTLKSVTDAQ